MESNKTNFLKKYELIFVKGIAWKLGFGSYGSVQLGKCLRTG